MGFQRKFSKIEVFREALFYGVSQLKWIANIYITYLNIYGHGHGGLSMGSAGVIYQGGCRDNCHLGLDGRHLLFKNSIGGLVGMTDTNG